MASVVTLKALAVEYDGTNAQEIITVASVEAVNWSVQSEQGGVLVLESDNSAYEPVTIPEGHIVVTNDGGIAPYPPALFAGRYHILEP